MRKPRVSVWYSSKGHWRVGVEAPLLMAAEETWRTVVVAGYTTRASANEYAKRLRRALAGEAELARQTAGAR